MMMRHELESILGEKLRILAIEARNRLVDTQKDPKRFLRKVEAAILTWYEKEMQPA